MKGFKTLLFGALIAGLGGIQATDLATIIPQAYVGLVMGAIGLVIMALRALTTTPMGQPE